MKSKIKKLWFPLVIIILLMTLFIFATYELLSNATTNIVLSSMDELASHDMKTINDFITDRWNMINTAYLDIQSRSLDSIDDLLYELKIKSYSLNFDHFHLIDEEGVLYSYTPTICQAHSDDIMNFFAKNEGKKKFISRYETEDDDSGQEKEYLIYGLDISDNPIVLNDNSRKFVKVVVLNDIAKIRQRIRISCFDGRGYSSIVDRNGQYIVTAANEMVSGQYSNIFDVIRSGRPKNISMDQLISNINVGKNFDFWYTSKEGVQKFVQLRILESEGSQWIFVTSLEKSIFTDQINQFIRLTTGIITILLFVMLIAGFVFYYSRKRLKSIYAGTVDGVYNRKYYNDKAANMHVKALAMIDLDHLKNINDSFGHLAGDKAIESTAISIVRNVGSSCDVLRFGGDEFVVIFHNDISHNAFRQILENMLTDIRKVRFPEYPKLKLTFSIGGCCCEGKACEILARADELLYEAKKRRNCIVTSSDDEKLSEK